MNPLNSFKNQMIDFEICRNSLHISTEKGLKNTENSTHKKYIGFFPNADIQVGDILSIPNSNIKYYVIDTDTATYMGEIYQIKAYYQNTPPNENKYPNHVVFNVQDSPNSIIGTQTSAIINNPNFNISDLDNLIETHGGNDKKELYQLSSQLQELLEKDDFHKSKLSKFSDLIAKHSWLPTAIAQIISAFLQSH